MTEGWLAERDIEQWIPREATLSDVVHQIERREQLVSTTADGIIAGCCDS